MPIINPGKGHLISISSDKDLTINLQEKILKESIQRIQMDIRYLNITEKGWKILGSLIKQRPSIPFRIYGGGKNDFDVRLLEYISDVESLSIEGYHLVNPELLAQLKCLKSFCISADCENLNFLEYIHKDLQKLFIFSESHTPQKADLSYISRFEKLTFLKLRHYGKNVIPAITKLLTLEELFLASIKLSDLTFLTKLPQLKKLGLSSCNISDYTLLSQLKELKCLVLYRSASLESLDFINKMTSLQFLFVQSVNKPTAFPNISALTKLRKIILYSMKSMKDFTALAESKNLDEFVFYEFKTQKAEDFIPALNNVNIKHIYLWAVKSLKFQNEVEVVMMSYKRNNDYLQFLGDSDFEYQ